MKRSEIKIWTIVALINLFSLAVVVKVFLNKTSASHELNQPVQTSSGK